MGRSKSGFRDLARAFGSDVLSDFNPRVIFFGDLESRRRAHLGLPIRKSLPETSIPRTTALLPKSYLRPTIK